jgi:hypothetical protein
VARAPPPRQTADITTNVGTDAFVRPAKRSKAENKNKNQKEIFNAKTRWR